jgi:hypothetical protein
MVSEDYAARYHQPSDVVHDLWDYDGIHQDLWFFYNIGRELANNDDFPNWAPESEFRAARDAFRTCAGKLITVQVPWKHRGQWQRARGCELHLIVIRQKMDRTG